jgi:hypothetical protein
MTKGIILSHGIADLIINSNLEVFNKLKADRGKVTQLLVKLLSQEMPSNFYNDK